jgi:hypothetical protein
MIKSWMAEPLTLVLQNPAKNDQPAALIEAANRAAIATTTLTDTRRDLMSKDKGRKEIKKPKQAKKVKQIKVQ